MLRFAGFADDGRDSPIETAEFFMMQLSVIPGIRRNGFFERGLEPGTAAEVTGFAAICFYPQLVLPSQAVAETAKLRRVLSQWQIELHLLI